jgi:hypothetical protein
VKGGVDVYNAVFNHKKESSEKMSKQEKRISELEERLARTNQFMPHPGTLELRKKSPTPTKKPVYTGLQGAKPKPNKPKPPIKK